MQNYIQQVMEFFVSPSRRQKLYEGELHMLDRNIMLLLLFGTLNKDVH